MPVLDSAGRLKVGTDAGAGGGASASGGPSTEPATGGSSNGSGGGLSVGAEALLEILKSGRVCPTRLLETHLDPDAAWKSNEPLPIRRGPLLFDFNGLPKPNLVPSKSADASQKNA